ncbi:MAG: DUF2442 domain-containing protein [Saprospiraceae bacterium]|nr:DUF2442 domain-containing protein [Saprospiraceae bacterium]MBK7736745.1 DUF2442 domain-containing protein [Saprospiraceae bacterium]MBK7911892.1 DUF2442 domain-containing protein [Saprospiraceae bacterium]
MNVIRVIDAKHLESFKLSLKFNDGLTGEVDLENELYGEIFEPLNNIDYFKKFTLDTWTICWPNGADFSPEFLYELAAKSKLELVKK